MKIASKKLIKPAKINTISNGVEKSWNLNEKLENVRKVGISSFWVSCLFHVFSFQTLSQSKSWFTRSKAIFLFIRWSNHQPRITGHGHSYQASLHDANMSTKSGISHQQPEAVNQNKVDHFRTSESDPRNHTIDHLSRFYRVEDAVNDRLFKLTSAFGSTTKKCSNCATKLASWFENLLNFASV